jgi:hypothetical protein
MKVVKNTGTQAHEPHAIREKFAAQKAITEGELIFCWLMEFTECFYLKHVNQWVGWW